ncbi:hypothetical protein HED60_08600 [Planctomycetales bacterium ZRK34]|nr:hypothetical protein HED60_08600 [Planctomycetales bacterium ZRK34]
MSQSTSQQDAAAVFTAAMQRGDLVRADEALAAMGKAVPPALLEPAADLHMHHARWTDAGRLLGRIVDQTPEQQLKRTLSRNMAELTEHRPELAARLNEAGNDGGYQITAAPSGKLTIMHTPPGSRSTVLSPMNNPEAALAESMRRLAEGLNTQKTIGIYGLGDGYLLRAVADHDPQPLPSRPRSVVHVVVEDPQHLTAALAIHDYTGPAGPIQQPRFFWWVGSDWEKQVHQAMCDESMIPFPQVCTMQGQAGDAIEQGMRRVGQAVSAISLQLQPRLDAYYEQLDRGELAAVFGENPPRAPRALVITSRFTTVLQYSARDSVDALRRLGWQVELLIEVGEHLQITGTKIQRLLDEMRPDMIFVIDHLRTEYPRVFPAKLPWVCWVQDHLPNLTNRAAGATVTQRDFVLTPFGPLYASRHGYPIRQCVALGKLTRIPQRPASWTSDGDDFAFVSHASDQPDAIVSELVKTAENDPQAQMLIRCCAQRMIDLYGRGQSLGTPHDVRLLFEDTERETGISIHHPEHRPYVIDMLFTRLNNVLYRQQALGWFADAADERGLSLALYGDGWDQHPRFARYARGRIEYGADLEDLARRTKINLQIVPFFCLHQRLLDGLAAGGFFLVRANTYDTIAQRLINFVDAHFGDDDAIDSVEAARQAIDRSQREMLDAELKAAEPLAERGDVIGIIQSWRRAGWIIPQQAVLPHFDDVTFDSAQSARQCIERFIDDEQARQAIAEAQRQNIESRLSYTAGLERVTRQIGQLIADEQQA